MLRQVQQGDFPPPRSVDPAIDPALEAVCLKAMATEARGPLRLVPRRWPRTSSGGWPTSRSRPGASRWRGGHAAGCGATARLVTGAAAALVAGTVGLAAVLIVQTKAKADLANANAELTRSQAAVQARYDLAVEAIKTFHTGVSEDFLLKQDQFKDLRDRLLKSASDFYGKLGALLRSQSDFDLAPGTAASQLRGRQPDRNGRTQGRRPRDPSRGAGGARVNGSRAAGRS